MSDRCPRCGALIQAAVQWCGLCHADLRPPAPPVPEPVHALVASQAVADGSSQLATESVSKGKHARPAEAADVADDGLVATDDLSQRSVDVATDASADASPFQPKVSLDGIDLSVLAGGGGAVVAGPTAAVTRMGARISTPGAKIAVIAGGLAVVAVVGLIGLTIVGLFL